MVAVGYSGLDCIAWIVTGFLAGAVASLFLPARTRLGCIGTTVVGILGGIVGGWLFRNIFALQPIGFCGSLFVAVCGSLVILLILRGLRS